MSRDLCHCGHSSDSHYLDRSVFPPVRFSCLCTGCDCKRFADEDGPPPKAKVKDRPNHPSFCRCYDCKEWYRASFGKVPDPPDPDEEPDTDRMWLPKFTP